MCLLCSRRDLEAKAGYSMSSPEGCVSDTEQSCLCSSNQEVFSPNFGLRESVKFPKDFGMWHEVAKVFFFSAQFTWVVSDSSQPHGLRTPAFPVHHQLLKLLKLMSIKLVMPSNHRILCCPLLLLPLIFPSIRVFSSESVDRIRWSKYWSLTFNISLSVRGGTLTETAHPARHHSNHLHELFYNRRSWWWAWN